MEYYKINQWHKSPRLGISNLLNIDFDDDEINIWSLRTFEIETDVGIKTEDGSKIVIKSTIEIEHKTKIESKTDV